MHGRLDLGRLGADHKQQQHLPPGSCLALALAEVALQLVPMDTLSLLALLLLLPVLVIMVVHLWFWA